MSNSTDELRRWKEDYALLLAEKERRTIWQPWPDEKGIPHPQRLALESKADELFFGGSAGGGKTDLLLGLASTRHYRAVIFRREFPQMLAMIDRSRELLSAHGSYASTPHHIWKLTNGRQIEFSSMVHEHDKENQRGRDRDLHAWDEVTQFSESQFRFANAWNRSARPGQRCRIVATGNPPSSSEGEWVIRYWRPWLDDTHPNPAAPGELRWFARLDDEDVEVASGNPIQYISEKTGQAELIHPRSRTFIPAKLDDNPGLRNTSYRSQLQSLPEPLRSQALYGDFRAGRADDVWQVIPTAWIKAAQKRWVPEPPQPMSCLGLDVAHGGADSTVPIARHGPWFSKPKKYQGPCTDSGQKAAFLVLPDHKDGARVHVDGIGYGASCAEVLADKLPGLVEIINVQEASNRFDSSGRYKLGNIRTAMYWLLREALDPESGDNLALPPDQELLGDLAAPRFEVRASGIVVESKEDIKKRLGRSPDVGDAVCLAHWQSSTLRPFTVGTSEEKSAMQILEEAGLYLQ